MILSEAVGKTIDFLRRRKRDYQLAFGTPAGQQVLIDLVHFCRANHTTLHPNDRVSLILEGRRQVWLRITQHLHLNSEQLYQIYNGHQIKMGDDNEN